MELLEAIQKRRSVRRFTDYSVTDEELKQLIDAARCAPSWANTQAWEFVIVRERPLIEKIAETYSPQNPARKCSAAASALIVACAKTGLSGCKEGRDVTKFSAWFMFDLGMAVQNLCLRAHEMGLGTVVVGLMDHDACRRIIALPDGFEAVAAIPVGRPEVAGREGPPRKSANEITHLNRFGNPMFKSIS